MGASQNSNNRPPFNGRYARRLQAKRARRQSMAGYTDEDIHPGRYCSECGGGLEHDNPAWASAACSICEFFMYERAGLMD